ncbi:MAG: sugar ABC transporter permease [Oscillospiraceae bacterium]|nr:sugar ABC transporter permease [Oscillospiraceae bacterium]
MATKTSNPNSPTKFQKFFRNNYGFLFVLLWLVGFSVFRLYPFISSLIYSFSDFNLFKGISEWGLMNYQEIFANKKIMSSLGITFSYAFVTVPLKLAFALFIAYILNYKIKGVGLFRTAYYIPSILGGSVAIAVLWKALFRDEGLINAVIRTFGGEGVNWLAEPDYALFIISLLRVWQFGSAMVLFLAALKGVSVELYEAATIDGASKARQFFSITVPLITPVVFYNLVTQLCQAFQEFNGPYIITQGGPRGATTLLSLLIYNRAFQDYEMGMASAMAWVLFVIVMVLSLIAFMSQKYWVYYGDEK